jgi:glycosyltransferase involved in cell wall biosynthesis
MDRANHALAKYLARREDAEVHLVAHRAWDDVTALPNVRLHQAPRPLGSHLLGIPFLAQSGCRWARRLTAKGARVVVNGGNCTWGDINWVHYVHAAWIPKQGGGWARRAKTALLHRYFRRSERTCVRQARLVVANSEQTRTLVIERLGVPAEGVHTVYYGIDAEQFHPPTEQERAIARAALGVTDDRPLVVFVGALGDLRKGFDTLFEAWRLLCADSTWDARLIVVGAGSALRGWQLRASEADLGGSIEFLGFRSDIPAILGACDILVSPTRYEAYGLNVQEAICSGLPAMVSASAGVAERYPAELEDLLLPDSCDARDLADRLRRWRGALEHYRARVTPLSEALRLRTWDMCAADIVRLAEQG